eukprot:GSChrysophyteH1.ASY1.ANO1.2508.1 assembled CDS
MGSNGGNPILSLAYTSLIGLWASSYFYVVPISFNVVSTATIIVYIGSHRSLRLLASESEGGTPKAEKDVMKMQDAAQFPIVGSIALFGLFMAFKLFDKDTINVILSVYFGLIAVLTMSGMAAPMLRPFLASERKYGFKTTFPVIGEVDLLYDLSEVLAMAPIAYLSVLYFQTKHYMLNNLFGIAFCLQSLERISIGSYKIGAILLGGLFIFGSNVMVSVAKNFDGPIKLVFPKSLPGSSDAAQAGEFSILGLGDIVVPGMFVSILLRFDAYMGFAKPYFHWNIIFYALGLAVTLACMYIYNVAQPALLYLVPACLGASFIAACLEKNFSLLLSYDEEQEDEAESSETKLKDGKKDK